jgi:phenylacetate-CoA ligase
MGITALYYSLLDLCRRRIDADQEFLSVKKWTCAPLVDFDLFEEYRIFRLRRTLTYVTQQSRFYRRLFSEAGVEPAQISAISDLARLPLTKAEDIADDPFAFLCISQGMVERAVTFVSSGTVGPRKRVFFSEADVEAIIDYMAAGMKTVADESDVVQILLPGGTPFSQGDLLARGVDRMGARPVFTGMFASPEEQIAAIRENGSTVLFGETHLIYRITKLMERDFDLKDLGMRTLFLATSYASPAMTDYLADTWKARVNTHYGLTEMGLGLAVSCPVCGGYHFNELDVIGEVIDPATGEPLPSGSSGELVFTSIGREAMPLIRYRTRDVTSHGYSGEQCMATPLRAIGQVPYRSESVVYLRKGILIHPTLFHEVLFPIPDVIDYELSVKEQDDFDLLCFDIEVVRASGLLQQRITNVLRETPLFQKSMSSEIDVRINLKKGGQLQEGPHFKKVIKDLRAREIDSKSAD